jgi:predicted amidophosphoribosyltransferase
MDAEASPPRSISSHLRGVLGACRDALAHLPKLALDIALPTQCVSCREPVDGEGVCASCWAKLSFIEPPYCPRLGIPFVYDPGPELLSMEAIASPPAYQRATNVQGAFKVVPERSAEIAGRRVVLIDDVLTSGATTDACARALLRAKAAQVDVVVFARVVDSHRAPI